MDKKIKDKIIEKLHKKIYYDYSNYEKSGGSEFILLNGICILKLKKRKKGTSDRFYTIMFLATARYVYNIAISDKIKKYEDIKIFKPYLVLCKRQRMLKNRIDHLYAIKIKEIFSLCRFSELQEIISQILEKLN